MEKVNQKKHGVLLYAPNVHTGGGLVLLQAILQSWPTNTPLNAWLDIRARDQIQLPGNAEIEWVIPSLSSRISAEISLAKSARKNKITLCFHGLPPLLPNSSKVLVFSQNRLYLRLLTLNKFSWRTRQRIRLEQAVAYIFRKRCSGYLVQTPSMARDLRQWYGNKDVTVLVLPFIQKLDNISHNETVQWDFLYVADGEAHKNHRRLVEAWVILAHQGFRPSLALTLSSRDTSLLAWINKQISEYDLRIENLGQMPNNELLPFYWKSAALIFPSLIESFGLPLIEARKAGLPIVASELDFVRDVCEPVQTFDPLSPTSIARAVRRCIRVAETPLNPVGAEEFLRAVMGALD